MTPPPLPVQVQARGAALEPGEGLIKAIEPATSVVWRVQGALATVAVVGALNMFDASSGTTRMFWTALAIATGYHVLRDTFKKSKLMAESWRLTDRRLIGPEQDWALADIERVSSFLHEVRFSSKQGGKSVIRYQPEASQTVAAIKAAIKAAEGAAA